MIPGVVTSAIAGVLSPLFTDRDLDRGSVLWQLGAASWLVGGVLVVGPAAIIASVRRRSLR